MQALGQALTIAGSLVNECSALGLIDFQPKLCSRAQDFQAAPCSPRTQRPAPGLLAPLSTTKGRGRT